MKSQERAEQIKSAIESLAAQIETLAELGEGIPAVEKNMARLRGSLRALEVQFSYLDTAGSG